MNIVLRILLCGVYDPDSILFALNGTPHIVKAIWLMLKKLLYLISDYRIVISMCPLNTSEDVKVLAS